jgi:predicted P-loop ATPase/GTPase
MRNHLSTRISMDFFHLRYSYDPEDIEKINPQHIRRITADQYTVRGSVTCNHQYDNQSTVVLLMAQVKCQHFFVDFMMTQLGGNDFPFPILTMSSWYMWLPTCCIKLDRTGW